MTKKTKSFREHAGAYFQLLDKVAELQGRSDEIVAEIQRGKLNA